MFDTVRETKRRIYMGCTIERYARTGLWTALTSAGSVRADTLGGLKELIREREGRNEPRKARTPVMFRVSRNDPADVFAIFPAQAGTSDLETCSIYQHVGQHSSGDLSGCIRTSRAAKPEEYRELRAELERIGYALEIVKRPTKAHRNNRARQIDR